MPSINKKQPKAIAAARRNSLETHGGAPAAYINAEAQLRRSVMSCMLWEGEFYENGEAIADRISKHAAHVKPAVLAKIADECRNVAHMRHVPLWLVVTLLKTGQGERGLIVDTIQKVIQRADEPGELLALYQKVNGKDAPLSNPLKIGLAKALQKFDAYQMSKYKGQPGKTEVRLRDVLFLTHAKPGAGQHESLFKALAEDTLATSDTWETELSAGADKRETFERLIRENRLGYLALLRNLRNMDQAGCDAALIKGAIRARRGADRVLPFRFIAAANHAPQFADDLDFALAKTVEGMPKLPGKTLVLVDVSGSMRRALSAKSDLTRMDAAATLASVIPCEDLVVCSFSTKLARVQMENMINHVMMPPRGLRGINAIVTSQGHSSTALFEAVTLAAKTFEYDRMIIITDEQATYEYQHGLEDRFPDPKGKGYMINVASAKNGVGYGKWVHLDGFSENVLRWIAAKEQSDGAE